MRLIDFFDHGADLHPDRACFHNGENAYLYRDVQKMTHRIANGLLGSGLGKGARVAVYSPNDSRAFECVLGTLRAGMVWVPINARNAIAENIYILNANDCEWFFYHSAFEQYIKRYEIAVFVAECPALRHIPPFEFGSAERAGALNAGLHKSGGGGFLIIRSRIGRKVFSRAV